MAIFGPRYYGEELTDKAKKDILLFAEIINRERSGSDERRCDNPSVDSES